MFSLSKRKSIVRDLSWLHTDIHSHILPGIDDGAPDAATSLDLLRGLSQLGLKKFIVTPHVFMELYPNTRESIGFALGRLKTEPGFEQLNVEVGVAAEYMLDADFKTLLQQNQIICLQEKYILVEMSYLNETRDIEQHIFDLVLKGFTPVLAHPERYLFYHQKFERYHRLKEMGCLFQMNLLAVEGYYGRYVYRVAERLLKEDLIDLFGTDLHHERHMHELNKFVTSGRAYEILGKYRFKNREVFG